MIAILRRLIGGAEKCALMRLDAGAAGPRIGSKVDPGAVGQVNIGEPFTDDVLQPLDPCLGDLGETGAVNKMILAIDAEGVAHFLGIRTDEFWLSTSRHASPALAQFEHAGVSPSHCREPGNQRGLHDAWGFRDQFHLDSSGTTPFTCQSHLLGRAESCRHGIACSFACGEG
jgi:hypothetical protein